VIGEIVDLFDLFDIHLHTNHKSYVEMIFTEFGGEAVEEFCCRDQKDAMMYRRETHWPLLGIIEKECCGLVSEAGRAARQGSAANGTGARTGTNQVKNQGPVHAPWLALELSMQCGAGIDGYLSGVEVLVGLPEPNTLIDIDIPLTTV
jgi:hypothetical protein